MHFFCESFVTIYFVVICVVSHVTRLPSYLRLQFSNLRQSMSHRTTINIFPKLTWLSLSNQVPATMPRLITSQLTLSLIRRRWVTRRRRNRLRSPTGTEMTACPTRPNYRFHSGSISSNNHKVTNRDKIIKTISSMYPNLFPRTFQLLEIHNSRVFRYIFVIFFWVP